MSPVSKVEYSESMTTQSTKIENNNDSAEVVDNTVENEDQSSTDLKVKPWDPKDIRITTKTFTIREINNQILEGELDLAPDFQRSFVWEDRRQIRLIESILLGIPLPAFYFNQEKTGALQVIDGVQRLTTIKHFMSDSLILKKTHLEYLGALTGETFNSLDPAIRRRFAATQIVAHVIEPQTPDEVKYDIFNRVNTGGSPLEAQEIRHCMSKSTSREFLRSLVQSPSFDKAMGQFFWSNDVSGALTRNNRRMLDRELALRFCAFYSTKLDEYSKASSLDAFLLEFTRLVDLPLTQDMQAINLDTLKMAFEQAMENCHFIFGQGAFRRWPPYSRRGPLNRAVFESQAIALADYKLDEIRPHKDAIQMALRDLFNNTFYDGAVRYGTSSYINVKRRIEMPRDVLARIIS